MKRCLVLLVCFSIVCVASISAFAGGDKVQHEHEQGVCPGPGSDAMANQSH